MKSKWISMAACILFVLTMPAIAGRPLQEGAREVRLKVSQLPAAVVQAIKANCVNCVVSKATREIENGVTVYDLEFKTGQGEMDVAEDGFVIDRETVVQTKDIPEDALNAIKKAAGNAKIKQIVKDEVQAELKDGQVVKLSTPRYLYEADLVRGNQVAEVQVSAEGQVTEAPKWVRKGTKEN